MSRPAVAAPLLAVLVGVAAFLFWIPWANSAFDGRARSPVLPQLLWLGWALLMVVAARLPVRRAAGTFLGSAVVFYAAWGVTFVFTSWYSLQTQHG